MIGSRLGCWLLEREVGQGGMGTVYFARREGGAAELPEAAAVKVLATPLVGDAGARLRFQREVEVLSRLRHPHIVCLFDSGEQDGHLYYAMEYVEGPSFETILGDRGKLPWPEVLDLALQVSGALKHAHDHGVIHRDLKPSNLLRGQPLAEEVGRYGVVKLTDFGIAWVFAGQHLTVTGAVVGTAEYLSPEQAAGKTPTKKSDLYSLGAVLYTLLSGRPPFTGEIVDVLHKQRYGQYERLARLLGDLPHDFEQVIVDLLEKEPDKRPPDAGVLHRKLDSLRRKYDRQAVQNTMSAMAEPTSIDADGRKNRTGPATMMAQLMREELERQNQGGPLQRFLNHPAVIVALFLLTVGLIVWAFLPPSPEKLYERGAALMQSSDPEQWELAWDKHLNTLRDRHPDFRRDEVEAFRLKAEEARERRMERKQGRFAGAMSEAQWFYEKGKRLKQQGKDAEARQVWRRVIAAFEGIEVEEEWVERCQFELDGNPVKPARVGEERWAPVRKALREAKRLEGEGKKADAERIRQSLRDLYADDPSAKAILDQ
jgi:serine/threonine protein kinase